MSVEATNSSKGFSWSTCRVPRLTSRCAPTRQVSSCCAMLPQQVTRTPHLDLLHALLGMRGEAEILVVAPEHVGPRTNRGLGQHVVQIDHLSRAATSRRHEPPFGQTGDVSAAGGGAICTCSRPLSPTTTRSDRCRSFTPFSTNVRIRGSTFLRIVAGGAASGVAAGRFLAGTAAHVSGARRHGQPRSTFLRAVRHFGAETHRTVDRLWSECGYTDGAVRAIAGGRSRTRA